MSIEKKLLGTSPSGGDAPNVEDVFSTYLYEGTGSTRAIANGIDLDGEGGMVWIKRRTNGSYHHQILDTERSASGGFNALSSNTTGAENFVYGFAFNSDGYTLNGGGSTTNVSGEDYASWTFRKAPRFFDVVTYTGNGTNNRQIAHNLGCQFGMLIVKCTSHTNQWIVWHRSTGNGKYLVLNETNAQDDDLYNFFGSGNTTNGSTHFSVSSNTRANESGKTYVAYLFAHDEGDGEFGETGNQDIIKCGSYTGNGNYSTGNAVDVGFEPQFIMIKNVTRADGNSDWVIYDTMRGYTATQEAQAGLFANLTDAETISGGKAYSSFITSSGFHLMDSNEAVNYNGDTYIYMAIRAPMMVEPEAGTEVFDVQRGVGSGESNYKFSTTINTDLFISKDLYNNYGSDITVWDRLRGYNTRLKTNLTSQEYTETDKVVEFGNNYIQLGSTNELNYSGSYFARWMFKRAKGFFDVVAYTGNGTAGHTVNHSLGVVPEMVIDKNRSRADTYWKVWLPTALGDYDLSLNAGKSAGGNTVLDVSASTFTLNTESSNNNSSGDTYIAYLFATLAGVSKVGSYTGNGSSQNIACGFSAGARFVLIKRTDANGDWYIWDTARGINTGNDPHLSLNSTAAELTTDDSLNTTAAEVTTDDSIDPQSAGFTVNQVSATNINVSSATYIFLAIA